MLRRISVSFLLLAAGPFVAKAQAPRCNDATISGDGVGELRIGMPVDSVRARCRIVRDTIELDEGESGRVVYALIAGDTARLDVRNNLVEFIKVRRPRFATKDSLRPGMPLARYLTGRHPQVLVGEGKVFLIDQTHCGNSFGLSEEAYEHLPELGEAWLAHLPRSTLIDEIVVTGTAIRVVNGRCA